MAAGKIAIDVYAAETVYNPYPEPCVWPCVERAGSWAAWGSTAEALTTVLRALNRETGHGGVGFMPWAERGSTVGTMLLNWHSSDTERSAETVKETSMAARCPRVSDRQSCEFSGSEVVVDRNVARLAGGSVAPPRPQISPFWSPRRCHRQPNRILVVPV
jgi:hypothetical protein